MVSTRWRHLVVLAGASAAHTLGKLGDEVCGDGLELGRVDSKELLDLANRLHGFLRNIGLRP